MAERLFGDATQEEVDTLFLRMGEQLMPMFNGCVVPILREENEAPIQTGTGTLFAVGSYRFLVTAEHAAAFSTQQRKQLYICDTPLGSDWVPLAGIIHSEKKFDVALWELSPWVVEKIPNRQFLTVHHADRARLRTGKGVYYVHGYPFCWSAADRNEMTVEVKAFTYGTRLYDGPTDALDGYDPRIHLLLEISADCSDGTGTGRRPQLPSNLGGISGSSIWQAYSQGLPPSAWSVNNVVIVAVQTAVYRQGAIARGTCWAVVHEMLWRQYPGLRVPLSIATPAPGQSLPY